MKKRLSSILLFAALVLTLLPATARAESEPDNLIFDVSEGNIIVSAGTTSNTLKVTYGATQTLDNIPEAQVITITGDTSTNVVALDYNVMANITLKSVSIDLSKTSSCAFDMVGAKVNLLLDGSNTLKSGGRCAGLHCPVGTVLTITDETSDGTGKLTTTGSIFGGAGIGSNGSVSTGETCGSVFINSGTISATGSGGGAGIGGGEGSTISGGTGAGSGGTVTISGGSISATGISNGAGIGGSYMGKGGAVYISGGSVKAIASNGADAIGHGSAASDGGVRMNKPSGENVYLTTVTLPSISSVTKILALTVPSVSDYGTKDVYTDDTGKLYLYLPTSTQTTAARTAVAKYGGAVATLADSTGAGVLSKDMASPTVLSITPSTGVAISGSVALTFNEEMRSGSGTVSITNNGMDYISLGTGSWSVGNTVYTAPHSGLYYNTTYAVKIEGFQDYSGNTMLVNSSHTFITVSNNDASLSALTTSQGTMAQAFSSGVYTYSATVENNVSSITVSPTANDANATIKVNGTVEATGAASNPISLSTGENTITVEVTAQDGTTKQTYTITVTRAQAIGGYSPTYYTLAAAAGAGGSISPSGSRSVANGNDMTYTITADKGFKIEDVLVDGVSVGAVSSYTFKNVSAAHTISVFFKNTENLFTDVNMDDWFYENVMYIYENKFMTGTDSKTFNPNGTMTRGMIVTVLHRLSGDKGGKTNSFSNVPSGSWYENAAAWAAANGITSGIGGNQFAPENSLTREQLAVMLYNYAKYKGRDVSAGENTNFLSYNDALTISDYAYSAFQWACGAGIMKGDGSSNLNPQASATRAEVAAMLQRFIENVIN